MRKKIILIGSSNTDMIVRVPRLPKPGETILGGKFSIAAGGKGANQAVAAARAGGEVTLIARVGDDDFGERAIAGFIQDQIHVDYISTDAKEGSGVALIFVAEDGENSIAVASGANMMLSPDDIESARDVIASADIVVMQLEIPLATVEAAAALAFEHNLKVILNPAPARPLPDELLRKISILTPNESEAGLLAGLAVADEATATQAAKTLLAKGVDTVVITMGAQGAFVATTELVEMVPGFRVEAVDTTAAGDVFNGALAVALAEKKSIHLAVTFANAAAALAVTKLGAQPSIPRREEIESLAGRRLPPITRQM